MNAIPEKNPQNANSATGSEIGPSPDKPESGKTRSKFRLRFSLRFVLLATTACVLLTVWMTRQYKASVDEAEAIANLRELVAKSYGSSPESWNSNLRKLEDLVQVTYSYQYDSNGKFLPNAKPATPAWLHDWLGPHFLDRVVTLNIDTSYEEDSGDGVYLTYHLLLGTDSLDCISSFRNLKQLTLQTGLNEVTDYSALDKLKKLETLQIISRPIGSDPPASFPMSALKNVSTLKELEIDGLIIPSNEPLSFRLSKLDFGFPWTDGKPENESLLRHFGDLSQLESLKLAVHNLQSFRNHMGLGSLREASILCRTLESLDGLENSPLESVRILNCQQLKDYSALKGSEHLKKLEIGRYTSLKSTNLSVDDGKGFPVLEQLTIESDLESLNFLKHSPRLETIFLISKGISNIDVLGQSPNLRELILVCPNVKEINVSLNRLETFICKSTGLTRLNFLKTEENQLKHFSLDCSRDNHEWQNHSDQVLQQIDLDCLRFASKLEKLDVIQTGIENLDFAADMKNLTEVLLRKNNDLASVDGLRSSLASLEAIYLINNRKLISFGVLEEPMPQLTKLQILNQTKRGTIDHLLNVQLNLQGNLTRFEELEAPSQKIIGKPKYKYWEYDTDQLYRVFSENL